MQVRQCHGVDGLLEQDEEELDGDELLCSLLPVDHPVRNVEHVQDDVVEMLRSLPPPVDGGYDEAYYNLLF